MAQEIVGRVEKLIGNIVVGWAAPASGEAIPVDLELLLDGRVIGGAVTSVYRPDVENRGLMPVAGFRAMLDCRPWLGKDSIVTARVAGGGPVLAGAMGLKRAAFVTEWDQRLHRSRPSCDTTAEVAPRPISIVVRFDADDRRGLAPLLASVRAQTEPNWELLLIGDPKVLGSPFPTDPRIRIIPSLGFYARDLGSALALATGRYVLLLEPWAIPELEALEHFRRESEGGVEIIYGDEAQVDERGLIRGARLCPAFSHDLFLAKPFFGSCYLVAAETVREAIAVTQPSSASDPILVLHLLERSATISHLPVILCQVPCDQTYPPAPTSEVEGHLMRIDRPGCAIAGPARAIWRLDYQDNGGKVLIVIPTKDAANLVRQCIESIRRTTRPEDVDIVLVDHESSDPTAVAYFQSLAGNVRLLPYSGEFNFAAINNHAVATAGASHPFVLFLNNDVEALHPGWLEHMRGLIARRDVGVVGSTLLYKNGAIQHSGVILGLFGTADHSHKYLSLVHDGERLPGYLGSTAATRDYSAVTGACMMLRTQLFTDVGGFDENLPVDYNDIDLCLRIRSLGLKVLADTHAVLRHYESATRKQEDSPSLKTATKILHRRWGEALGSDPFYHPMLTLTEVDHAIERLIAEPQSRTQRLWASAGSHRNARPDVIDRMRRASALPRVD